MEKWECHFQMDSPGPSAVPWAGFSLGALLGTGSREVSEWLVRGQAVTGSCGGSSGWAEGGGDKGTMPQASPSSLPGAALLILLSTFLIPPLWSNQPGEQSCVLALGTSTSLRTQRFFRLLQQFLSSPLSGPTAKHMARPFICFNYSCAVEWHLWIIGNSSSSVTLLLHFHKHFKPEEARDAALPCTNVPAAAHWIDWGTGLGSNQPSQGAKNINFINFFIPFWPHPSPASPIFLLPWGSAPSWDHNKCVKKTRSCFFLLQGLVFKGLEELQFQLWLLVKQPDLLQED